MLDFVGEQALTLGSYHLVAFADPSLEARPIQHGDAASVIID
jgi:hypothetical protein